MPTRYETMILVSSLLSEDQAKNLVKEYKDFMKKNNVKLLYEEDGKLKKLAYRIRKKGSPYQDNAYRYLFEYDAEENFIKDFNLKLKRDEQVIRDLTIKLDKDAIFYNQERRSKIKVEEKINDKN